MCCGYGGTHTPEHRPVEIIYTLLFCRYAKTLPQPLETFKNGGCHPQTPLRPAPFARWMVGVFQLVVVHSLPLIVAGGGVRKEHRRLTVVDHTMRISTTQQRAGCYVGFENRAEFPTAHLVFFLSNSLFCCCCFPHTFLQPL